MKLPGLITVSPHGQWVIEGKKKWVIKSHVYHKYVGIPVFLVTGDELLGIIEITNPRPLTLKQFRETEYMHRITEEERKKWWPDATVLYAYTVHIIKRFDPPKKFKRPVGPQTWITEIEA